MHFYDCNGIISKRSWVDKLLSNQDRLQRQRLFGYDIMQKAASWNSKQIETVAGYIAGPIAIIQ